MKGTCGAVGILLLVTGCGRGVSPDSEAWEGHSVAGPWTQGNLAVFLIEKEGTPRGEPALLSMEEAIERKVLRITEREGGGQVNALEVENSGDRPVWLQAGDTLKGGKQDRTIAKDTLVLPKSGAVAVEAFCVEPGRWGQRASSAADFRANDVPLATKEQRLAVLLERDQAKVWEAGRAAIQALAPGNDSFVVASEDPKLREALETAFRALEGLIEGRDDVVGLAYAIGGTVHSAEVYGSAGLLRKFWPKLLRRSIVEALSRREAAPSGATASAGDVERFLRRTAGSAESSEKGAAGLERSIRRASGASRFDARLEGARLYTKFD
jgi:hypothetical protein